jgi:hypothetical protein
MELPRSGKGEKREEYITLFQDIAHISATIPDRATAAANNEFYRRHCNYFLKYIINYGKLCAEICQWLADRYSSNLCFGYLPASLSDQCTCTLRLTMNIYIGNLPYTVSEDDLRDAFSQFGQVDSANIITDKFSGRSKGFGFVDMPNDSEAREAIESMNDKDLKGRTIKVNEARPREERPARRDRY